MISNIMMQAGTHADGVQPDLVRHMVLNTIRTLKVKFSKEYGDLVIAADDRKYWRRDVFPHYKGTRKADREKSGFDWHYLFDTLNLIKQEIKDNMPYPVVQVEGAEADDVIGTLAMKYGEILNTNNKILILSGDKDFVQLQVYGNVSQFDPIRKKDMKSADPHKFIQQLILSGDRGDGIPNVLSPDNCLVEGQRQKALRETKMEQLLAEPFDQLPESIQRNWKRNEMLIDLKHIPTRLQESILEEYQHQLNKPRSQMFNYFIKHKMKIMIEHINDF